jgi:2-polyprenyl-3-methyl-5-hydroxy-6-metoxy-1,4-benzoquinol methylase
MIINENKIKYLNGDLISNGEKFYFKNEKVRGRNELLSEIVRGKKILHLGCADHIELIEKKRKMGIYLHDILEKSANTIIGADVNKKAIEEMTKHGIKNLYMADQIPKDEVFDLVLVPDVIEHVGNVEDFLKSLEKYNCPIVITTPNAFSISNRLQFNYEFTNTDHRYNFTPYTLSKTVYSAGFNVVKYYYTDGLSIYSPIKSVLKIVYPLLRDGLLIVIEKNKI